MTTIQIEDETAAAIRAEAEARGLTLDGYLRQVAIIRESPTVPCAADSAQAVHEFDQALDDMFAASSGGLPTGPLAESREDIYFDHD